MKRSTQKYKLEAMGGFSDTRLRLFILGFMSFGLIMTPFLGMLASFIVIIIFAIFTAVKVNEFQESNPESMLRHRQAMDRLYNYGAEAEYYETKLKPYDDERRKRNENKKLERTKANRHTKNVSLVQSGFYSS